MALPAYAMNRSNFPEMYERWLVQPLFRPFAEDLLDRAGLAKTDRVLDVGCGTGIVARIAKQRLGPSGRVVGVDASPQMLEVARGAAPEIDWREGKAGELPAEAGAFELVTCHQGLQFFPDRAAAVREMHRVLAPGGRLGAGTWLSLDEVPFFRDMHRVGERHVGPIPDNRHAFGDVSALERLLVEAGFQDVRVGIVSHRIRLVEAALIVDMNSMALVGMSLASKEMSEDQRTAAVAAVAEDCMEALGPYRDGGGIAFDLGTTIATARR